MHKEYIVDGVKVVHISEFASRVHINQATVRNMLERVEKGTEAGSRFRRALKYIRDDNTIWIPVSEIEDYPYIKGSNCYHFDPATGERKLCVECTMGMGCEKSKA